ncbi:MAG: hypothetical protein GTO18_10380 [Anaerolineales bacterium]|nr:hypothetical protein [Anaerolineales bacterium]
MKSFISIEAKNGAIIVLILLPILTFIVIFLILFGDQSFNPDSAPYWRRAFLTSTLIWGALVVIITEGLSLVSGLTRVWVGVSWAIVVLALFLYGVMKGNFQRSFSRIKQIQVQLTLIEWIVVIGMVMIIIALGVVAWIAPANTTDSLLYHMPRIAHWIQQSNLNHYPTAYLHQLWASNYSEMTILNLWTLWSSDQPANMGQWFALVGSLIGVSAITGLLGAGLRGQLLSAAFALSIPMGILQATSTQTDFVTAFWLVCLMYFVVLSKKRELEFLDWLSLALALGLGLLTKATYYPSVLPILIWFFLPRFRTHGFWKTFLHGLAIAAVALILNLGLWIRNLVSFGGPLGPRGAIDSHVGFALVPQVWISEILKKVALHYVSPWESVNAYVSNAVEAILRFLGVEFVEFRPLWSWNHEDLAGNPFHFAILTITILIILLRWRRRSRIVFNYALVLTATFLLFSIVVQFNIYSGRLQLPIFLLGVPLVGVVFSVGFWKRIFGILAIGFLLISLPWVLFNKTRPIIGMRPFPEPLAIPCRLGCTSTGSVFTRSREDLFFANWYDLQEPITSIAEEIDASGCQKVGLRLASYNKEYLYWWTLGAPSETIRIESIFAYPELEQYSDSEFRPCAVICTTCGDRTEAFGMKLRYNRQHLSLFIGDDYIKEIDG